MTDLEIAILVIFFIAYIYSVFPYYSMDSQYLILIIIILVSFLYRFFKYIFFKQKESK